MTHSTSGPSGGNAAALLPPRVLPVVYLAFAHAALVLAFAAIALDPRGLAGFFYHPRALAVVHLVTLGWITCSILGAIYIVAPMALRMTLRAGRLDAWACAVTLIGISGMVAHFWSEQFSGMAWSGLMTFIGIACVGARVIQAVRPAPISPAVKLHIILAFLNIIAAGAVGVLLGFDKVFRFLPGWVMANVYAHAHLAAVGWAGMMIVGISYRLLPMALPSAMPSGRGTYLTALLLQAGSVGLFASLVLRSAWVPAFAILTVAGFGLFVSQVVWMMRHPRPRPPALPSPDHGRRHVLMAVWWLAVAAVLGLVLVFGPTAEWTLPLMGAYGIIGLVGFFSQVIVGMKGRILATHAWYWAFANTGFRGRVPAPHEMGSPALQAVPVPLWLAGVPALAGGFYFDAIPLIAAGGWMLAAAAVIAAIDVGLIVRYAFVTLSPRRTAPAEENTHGEEEVDGKLPLGGAKTQRRWIELDAGW